jgi:hypothetical protein
MTGYTGPDDGKPLAPWAAKLFPPQRPPGGQEQPKTSLIHPAPDRSGQRPKPRKVTQPKKRAKPKKPASTPGGQQYRRGGKAQ